MCRCWGRGILLLRRRGDLTVGRLGRGGSLYVLLLWRWGGGGSILLLWWCGCGGVLLLLSVVLLGGILLLLLWRLKR